MHYQGRIQDLRKGGGGAAATASAAGVKVFGGSRLKTLFGISKGGGAPCAPPPESAYDYIVPIRINIPSQEELTVNSIHGLICTLTPFIRGEYNHRHLLYTCVVYTLKSIMALLYSVCDLYLLHCISTHQDRHWLVP